MNIFIEDTAGINFHWRRWEHSRIKYPFHALSIGQRFYVPFENTWCVPRTKRKMQTKASVRGKQLGMKFTSRISEKGVMITRVG